MSWQTRAYRLDAEAGEWIATDAPRPDFPLPSKVSRAPADSTELWPMETAHGSLDLRCTATRADVDALDADTPLPLSLPIRLDECGPGYIGYAWTGEGYQIAGMRDGLTLCLAARPAAGRDRLSPETDAPDIRGAYKALSAALDNVPAV